MRHKTLRKEEERQRGVSCFMPHASSCRGFSLLELVIGIAIITVLFIAVFKSYGSFLRAQLETPNIIKGSFLLEEGLEIARFWRDAGWATNIASLSTTTTYYFYWSGSAWQATTSLQVIDGEFYRTFSVSDVKRSGIDDIASSGTYDPNMKLVSASTSWSGSYGTTTKTTSAYIANLFSN